MAAAKTKIYISGLTNCLINIFQIGAEGFCGSLLRPNLLSLARASESVSPLLVQLSTLNIEGSCMACQEIAVCGLFDKI